MSKTTNPYEFLVRWDSMTGQIKGCHVKTVTTHIDDETNEVIAVKESEAMPVAWAQDNGFPLDQVLQAIHVDALATAAAEQAHKAAMEKDMEAERNTLNADKATLSAEIEQLKVTASQQSSEIEQSKAAALLRADEMETLKATVIQRDSEIEAANASIAELKLAPA